MDIICMYTDETEIKIYTFVYTGKLTNAVKAMTEQALVAYHNLLSLIPRIHLNMKT